MSIFRRDDKGRCSGVRCDWCGKIANNANGEYVGTDGTAKYIHAPDWDKDGGADICEECANEERPESPISDSAIDFPPCHGCGKRATCFGTYGGLTGYSCDKCCGHGCEDGRCDPCLRCPEKYESAGGFWEPCEIPDHCAACGGTLTEHTERTTYTTEEAIEAVAAGSRCVTETTHFPLAHKVIAPCPMHQWRTVACDNDTDVIECSRCGLQTTCRCDFDEEFA